MDNLEQGLSAECPFCPEGHLHASDVPWDAWLSENLDAEGKPVHIVVAKQGGIHVDEADAEWLRRRIFRTQALPYDVDDVVNAVRALDGLGVSSEVTRAKWMLARFASAIGLGDAPDVVHNTEAGDLVMFCSTCGRTTYDDGIGVPCPEHQPIASLILGDE